MVTGGPELRIGFGFDVHRIVPGRKLVLGGVEIPWEQGLLGHSDADVLLHAIMDAILGALALGDIGEWFPDTDQTYRGADSGVLLRRILEDPRVSVWRLINLDCTLLAEKPKISPYRQQIRQTVADLLRIPVANVSVKATTTETLGYTGRGEGMAAHAAVLLRLNESSSA